MPIITPTELAAWVDQPETPNLILKANLADQIVTEAIYPTGLPVTIPARVKAIVLEVAARAVRNPNGYSSETVDDYTYRRDADTRQAGIYLTDAERIELLGLTGVQRSGVRSIRLTSPLDA
ncbi:Gp19/Gp15/Gp42 family protein [Nocardioides kribbensis]|uniref:Gp19/Gp15/Gp42 family protein n=1 Tax=Nocardioides kribbensis TaxID=305517 RepID=A0ABV1NYX0_9ACTN